MAIHNWRAADISQKLQCNSPSLPLKGVWRHREFFKLFVESGCGQIIPDGGGNADLDMDRPVATTEQRGIKLIGSNIAGENRFQGVSWIPSRAYPFAGIILASAYPLFTSALRRMRSAFSRFSVQSPS
jgi:hypothetical protein